VRFRAIVGERERDVGVVLRADDVFHGGAAVVVGSDRGEFIIVHADIDDVGPADDSVMVGEARGRTERSASVGIDGGAVHGAGGSVVRIGAAAEKEEGRKSCRTECGSERLFGAPVCHPRHGRRVVGDLVSEDPRIRVDRSLNDAPPGVPRPRLARACDPAVTAVPPGNRRPVRPDPLGSSDAEGATPS
jgi:hypothetical protein